MSLLKRREGLLSTLDRWLDDVVGRRHEQRQIALQVNPEASWRPQVDVTESEKEYRLVADLPGVDGKDIDVRVQDGNLIVCGKREQQREEKKGNVYWRECAHGSFYRSFSLPEEVDVEQISATYKNGELEVRLPREKGRGPKKVKVQAA